MKDESHFLDNNWSPFNEELFTFDQNQKITVPTIIQVNL